MPDSDKTLKILLQVQSDTAELQKVTSGLQEVQNAGTKSAQAITQTAEAAGTAAGRVSPLITGVLSSLGLGLAGVLTAIPALINTVSEGVRNLADEQLKLAEAGEKNIDKFIQLTRIAQNASDVLKLSTQLGAGVEQAAAKFDEFRKRELGAWETFGNNLLTLPFISPQGPLLTSLKNAQAQSEQNLRSALAQFTALRQTASETATAFQRIQTLPLIEGVSEINARLATLKTEVSALGQSAEPPLHATTAQLLAAARAAGEFIDKSAEMYKWQDALDALLDRLFKVTAAFKDVQSQIRSNLAAAVGNAAGVLDERLSKLRDDTFNKLFTGNNALEAARLADELVNSERQKAEFEERQREAAKGSAAAHHEIRDLLASERLQLEAIKSDISAVESNPLLTLDQKNVALAQLLPQAIAQLNAQINANKTAIRGSALDPTQLNAVRSAIQRDSAEIAKLQQQLKTTTFSGQFQASLIQWVNQFGTTAQQIAGLITNTIGNAINGLSSGLTGIIFRTQSVGQAALQMGQQFVQSLLNVGLQMVAQKVLGSILTAATVTEQSAAGTAIAAANAPAAAATSIASYGGAAVSGGAAAAAAIAAIIGALTGGFEAGGYTGPGHTREVAGVVHRDEFVFSSPAVRKIGVANLAAMHSDFRRSSYEVGGLVGGSASRGSGRAGVSPRQSRPIINQALFLDLAEAQKWLRNREGDKYIIDLVNRRGGNLRT